MRKLSRAARRAAAALGEAIDLRDVHLYGGLALAGSGGAMLSVPLALIGVGVVLMAFGFLAGRGARQ